MAKKKEVKLEKPKAKPKFNNKPKLEIKTQANINDEELNTSFIEITDEDKIIQEEIFQDVDNSDIIVDNESSEYTEEEIDELNWSKHLEKAKSDKIFNNSYNTDENLKEPWEYEYGRSITVEKTYESRFEENYNPDGHLVNTMTKKQVEDVIKNNPILKPVFESNISDEDKKYSKKEINDIFKIIFTEIRKNNMEYSFVYIFDYISKYVNVNYKKLFDLLDYQYKEVLILELNEQFGLLDDYKKLGNFF